MFSWDETKREKVISEHNIDFAKIGDVFDDPFAVYFEDYEHSTGMETRINVIGHAAHYGLIFAVYVYEGESDIHLITARRAENWMVTRYEENRKGL